MRTTFWIGSGKQGSAPVSRRTLLPNQIERSCLDVRMIALFMLCHLPRILFTEMYSIIVA